MTEFRVGGQAMTEFRVGDYVEKFTGDYVWAGRVASVFLTSTGKERIVVEHNVQKGVVLHIYAPSSLRTMRRHSLVLPKPKE